ncbi:hypothetical protein BLA29_001074, partial [Euroglyphus maynei]
MSDLMTTLPSSSTDLNASSLNNSEDKKDSILQLFQYDLDRHRMREVWDMFNRVVVTEIHNNGSYIVWDLVPIICQRLRGLSEFRFKTFSMLSLSSFTKINPETDDRFKLMFDPVVNNLNSVLSMYVDFLETFVKEVDLYNPTTDHQHQSLNNIHSKTSDPNIQRIILLKTLLLMLEYPLKYMDLYQVSGKESIIQDIKQAGTNLSALFNEDFITSRMIAIKIVRLISSLHSNLYTLLSRTDLITSSEDMESNPDCSDICLSQTNFQSAMSVLSYLLANESELSPSNFMPRVYTHVYNLGIHLPYIKNLVEDQQFFVYEKGLHLLAAMLAPIKEESLEANFLDLLRQYPIEKSLTSIM